jgi:NAD(P)-dependent dehydrogenase (short-subunit alcohol dehydrogenase family)
MTEDLAALRDAHDVLAVPVDLSTADGPADLVATAIEHHGDLDILVNNVGASRPGPTFTAIDDAAWQRLLDINFFSAVRATRAAIPS